MVTSKDLVEASVFGRRRLVNAFLSGVQGGHAPAAVGRTIFWSVVLALLLLVVAAVTRYLEPPGF